MLWIPKAKGNDTLCGEVKGTVIYIYTADEKLAQETLKHEFIDRAISHLITPYKELANALISLINEQAYQDKEKLVNAFSALID